MACGRNSPRLTADHNRKPHSCAGRHAYRSQRLQNLPHCLEGPCRFPEHGEVGYVINARTEREAMRKKSSVPPSQVSLVVKRTSRRQVLMSTGTAVLASAELFR